MKVIDKMSYALWVYDNTCSTTVGFYKVTGSDLKELLPHIITFNRTMAGKVEVHDPMPWGKARAHTWQAIVDNRFDKEEYAYAHCGPDGSNMSDDDMLDYWINGNDNAESNSVQSKEDFLRHLDELSATPASKFSDVVYELAEFVTSMHPEKEKEHLWIGLNFIRCANEVVRVLQAMPAALTQLGPAATFEYPMDNGPTIHGAVVSDFIGCGPNLGRGCDLVVCANGDVWSVDLTAAGPSDNPTVSRVGTRLNLSVSDPYGPSLKHEGTIDPDYGRWHAIPTALEVLHSVVRGPLKRALTAKAHAKAKQALVIARGPDALEPATASAN